MLRLPHLTGLCALALLTVLSAEEPGEAPEESRSRWEKMGLDPSWETQTDARYFSLKIPAPRGQITDRFGRPLAQTKVTWYLALQLEGDSSREDASVLAAAKNLIGRANTLLQTEWSLDDSAVIEHFRNRRWVPQVFSEALTVSQKARVEEAGIVGGGLMLFPSYERLYPQNALACHVIGYVGKRTPTGTERLVSGEPLYPMSEGRDGLERSFDAFLRGRPGEKVWLFDNAGRKIYEEQIAVPEPGGHVVTTLDLDMQELAERTLAYFCKRGAFVILDIESGDILVLASNPGFDLNQFVPAVSFENFEKLQKDPNLPLVARAFRGMYPPASVFKPVVALAALDAGVVDPTMEIDCPGEMRVDGRLFHNHSRRPEGMMNVARALARSCNTWFYEAGLKTGGDALVTMARRFGFGEVTGIPLMAEAGGAMPRMSEMRARYGYELKGGYLANASIGQGHVLATPLQVAQMMAGIASRQWLPQPRLVRQVQNSRHQVIRSYPTRAHRDLELQQPHLDAVIAGMIEVVHGASGTGRSGANNFHRVAGKTGTGQWGPSKDRKYVAWFGGFVPAENPRFAFAVLNEGSPGQYLSGGGSAAPMAAYFFNQYYRYIEPQRLEEQRRVESRRIARVESKAKAIEAALAQTRGAEEVRPAIPFSE